MSTSWCNKTIAGGYYNSPMQDYSMSNITAAITVTSKTIQQVCKTYCHIQNNPRFQIPKQNRVLATSL